MSQGPEAPPLAPPLGPDGGRFAYPQAERIWLALAICAALGGLAMALAPGLPFQARLGGHRTSLEGRSPAQRTNIALALRALDGAWVGPGARFSFNGVVGPRSPERGYQEAKAYMEQGLSRSVGGGVCQVSSTLYAALLGTRLPILERHPHGRRVDSVPPGLDAAVWFGKADLAFQNASPHPIRLKAWADPEGCHVELWGLGGPGLGAKVRTLSRPGPRGSLVVSVLRTEGPVERLMSRDLYLP